MPGVAVKVNKAAGQEIRDQLARRMTAAVLYFVAQHQQKLNVSNPIPHLNPSKPGEYPKKRTGFLQSSVAFSPGTLPEISRDLSISIGYDANAFYGPVLEVMRNRLGLVATLHAVLPQMTAIIGQPVTVTS